VQHVQGLAGMNGGHPSVYGDWLQAPGKPTLLLYGHYDVQPVDPLNQWRSLPVKATIVSENLCARGASDDKGQLFIHIRLLRLSPQDEALILGNNLLRLIRDMVKSGKVAPVSRYTSAIEKKQCAITQHR
jgi:hypothetical protein